MNFFKKYDPELKESAGKLLANAEFKVADLNSDMALSRDELSSYLKQKGEETRYISPTHIIFPKKWNLAWWPFQDTDFCVVQHGAHSHHCHWFLSACVFLYTFDFSMGESGREYCQRGAIYKICLEAHDFRQHARPEGFPVVAQAKVNFIHQEGSNFVLPLEVSQQLSTSVMICRLGMEKEEVIVYTVDQLRLWNLPPFTSQAGVAHSRERGAGHLGGHVQGGDLDTIGVRDLGLNDHRKGHGDNHNTSTPDTLRNASKSWWKLANRK